MLGKNKKVGKVDQRFCMEARHITRILTASIFVWVQVLSPSHLAFSGEPLSSGDPLHHPVPVTPFTNDASDQADTRENDRPLSAAAQERLPIPGDINGDLKVNLDDLVAMVAGGLEAGLYEAGEPATREQGDVNEDQVFDSSDIVFMFQNFGRDLSQAIRASSNPNFLYSITTEGTGEVLTLHEVTDRTVIKHILVGAGLGADVGDIVDVSPDGGTVVYSYTVADPLAVNGSRTYIQIQRVTNPGERYTIGDQGALEGVSFTAHQEAVVNTLTFDAIVVKLGTLIPFDYSIAPDKETVMSPNGRYQIKDERPIGRLLVADSQAIGSKQLVFAVTEAPIVSFNVTDAGIYYVVGHDAVPVIRYVSFEDIFAAEYTVPETAKQTVSLAVTPRDRGAIIFVSGQALADITDAGGVEYRIDLVTGQPITTPEENEPKFVVTGDLNDGYGPGQTVRFTVIATDQDSTDTVNITLDNFFYIVSGDFTEHPVTDASYDSGTGEFTWQIPPAPNFEYRYFARFVADSTKAEGGHGGTEKMEVPISLRTTVQPNENYPVIAVTGLADRYARGETVRLTVTATDEDPTDMVGVGLEQVFYVIPGDSRQLPIDSRTYSQVDPFTGEFTWELPANLDLNYRYFVNFIAQSAKSEPVYGEYGGESKKTVEIHLTAQ